jgi:hemoglobin
VILFAVSGSARADEDRTVAIDRLVESLRVAHNEGCDLYNGPDGDAGAAYYHFQSALLAASSSLEQRPDLQRVIRRGLDEAKQLKSMDRKAWALKNLILVVKTALPGGNAKTLWDRLGGEENVKRIADEWVDAMANDKAVNLTRDGKYPMGPAQLAAMKNSIVKLASDVGRGPFKYPGRTMLATHRGMGITNSEFDATLAHLQKALIRNQVEAADVSFVVAAINTTRINIVSKEDPVDRPGPGEGGPTSFWKLLGGEEKVTKIVGDWVDRMIADTKVNMTRNGKYPMTPEKIAKKKSMMVDMASQALGGPRAYTGPRLLPIHKDMDITDAEFDAALADLKLALAENGVPPGLVTGIYQLIAGRRGDFVQK